MCDDVKGSSICRSGRTNIYARILVEYSTMSSVTLRTVPFLSFPRLCLFLGCLRISVADIMHIGAHRGPRISRRSKRTWAPHPGQHSSRWILIFCTPVILIRLLCLCHQHTSLVSALYGTREVGPKWPVMRPLCNRSYNGSCSYCYGNWSLSEADKSR